MISQKGSCKHRVKELGGGVGKVGERQAVNCPRSLNNCVARVLASSAVATESSMDGRMSVGSARQLLVVVVIVAVKCVSSVMICMLVGVAMWGCTN